MSRRHLSRHKPQSRLVADRRCSHSSSLNAPIQRHGRKSTGRDLYPARLLTSCGTRISLATTAGTGGTSAGRGGSSTYLKRTSSPGLALSILEIRNSLLYAYSSRTPVVRVACTLHLLPLTPALFSFRTHLLERPQIGGGCCWQSARLLARGS